MRRVWFAFLIAVLLGRSASSLEIHGDILTDYRNGQRNVSVANTSSNSQFRLQSADLILTHDVTDIMRVLARGSSSRGGRLTLSEAWLQMDGLPMQGSFTLGRFFPPGGSPLPTLDVSLPTILYRSQVQEGMKFHFEPTDRWRWEIGAVDLNPLSTTGAVIGDAFVMARPNAAPASHSLRGYGHLGFQDGGAWGSVDLSANYYRSRLHTTDLATINGSGLYGAGRGEPRHEVLELSGDYLYGPYRIYGQWVDGTEGALEQDAWELAGSYRVGTFTWILAYGEHTTNAEIRGTSIPNSWNRERTTAGVSWQAHPLLKIQAEYEWNREDVGLAGVEDPVDNDVMGVQFLAVF